MWNGKVKLIEVPQNSMELLQNILCYILFGTVISFASPWLVLLLTVMPVVNWFSIRAYQNYEYRTRAERTDIEKSSTTLRRAPRILPPQRISAFTVCTIGCGRSFSGFLTNVLHGRSA